MIAIIYLAVCVLMIVSMWKIYEKLGLQGWMAIVPIYNVIVLGQLFKWDTVKIILCFVPIANIYFGILLMKEIADRFGKSTGFLVGMILLSFVFLPMLAFQGEVVNNEA